MSTKKKRERQPNKYAPNRTSRNLSDIYALILIAAAVLTLIFVFTSATGIIGKYINTGFEYGFGIGRNVLAFFLTAMAIYYLTSKSKRYAYFATGLIIIFISFLSFVHAAVDTKNMFKLAFLAKSGGLAGALFAYSFKFLLGTNAAYIIFAFALCVGTLLLTNKSLSDLWHSARDNFGRLKQKIEEKPPTEALTQKVAELKKVAVEAKPAEPQFDFEPLKAEKSTPTVELSEPKSGGVYELPPLSIFPLTQKSQTSGKKSIKENISTLEKTLNDFEVDAAVSKVVTGPTVTRYEVQLASGVKVNRILRLADDIALAFASPDVRILAPIPGKSAIGIEVPNIHRELVTIGDILTSEKMKNSKNLLSIAIGKDISGEPVIADLADMPHLLIAGATGSGKSVCINSILAAMLSRATPEQLKFILIDPKRVELNLFNDIPHLITPVLTQAKQAAHSLEWAVEEMENRFETLAANGVKNINSYNALMNKKGGDGMPIIVVVVDELADLMMVAAREVEDVICRIAQLARAVGIHLVIATQRPSTDVITGLIKANITYRIAFAVSSQTDSRVILDTGGAEKLVGKGDMLFSTPQSIKPKRIQAAFITEKEIESLCNHLKSQAEPNYMQDITAPRKSELSFEDYEDELYDKAAEIVVSSGKASVSYLQRRLRIGYGRAARLMDMLEDRGIVGPQDGAKPREVLVDREELTSLEIND